MNQSLSMNDNDIHLSRTEKKYLILPGYVTGSDGDRHFLSTIQLANLYGVSIFECVNDSECHGLLAYTGQYLDSLIHLSPQEDGNYSLKRISDKFKLNK